MKYTQLTPEERYLISHLRKQGFTKAQIAAQTGQHRSTIGRNWAAMKIRAGGWPENVPLASVHRRWRIGQELATGRIDTVMGSSDKHCIVTLAERKTGYVEIQATQPGPPGPLKTEP
jgi:IS30 family transposase